jgi:hypothetical protein
LCKTTITLVSTIFNVNIAAVPAGIQMHMTELHGEADLKKYFGIHDTLVL